MKTLALGVMFFAIVIGFLTRPDGEFKGIKVLIISGTNEDMPIIPYNIPPIEEKLQNGQNLTAWEEFQIVAWEISQKEDYPYEVLLAQAALESNRGKSHFAVYRNNFFGIGAYDHNPNKAFQYGDMKHGIHSYINLIKTRYQDAYEVRHDPHQMIAQIKRGGYATDPFYVWKITNMQEFNIWEK